MIWGESLRELASLGFAEAEHAAAPAHLGDHEKDQPDQDQHRQQLRSTSSRQKPVVSEFVVMSTAGAASVSCKCELVGELTGVLQRRTRCRRATHP